MCRIQKGSVFESHFAPFSGVWPLRPCAPLSLAGINEGPILAWSLYQLWDVDLSAEPWSPQLSRRPSWSSFAGLSHSLWLGQVGHIFSIAGTSPGTIQRSLLCSFPQDEGCLGTVGPFFRGGPFSRGEVIVMYLITSVSSSGLPVIWGSLVW